MSDITGAVKIGNLEDILTEKQLDEILQKTSKPGSEIINFELKPASEDMLGFAAEHYKAVLYLKEGVVIKKVYLFIKLKPRVNTVKAELMGKFDFYGKEAAVFKLFDKIKDTEFSGSTPWGVKAYVHNKDILVFPDLSVEGYVITPVEKYFDMNHVLVTLTSLANFHATLAKYCTQKNLEDINYKLIEDCRNIFCCTQFTDGPWLHASAKLTANFIHEFSDKRHQENLESLVYNQYVHGCSSLKEYKDTINVLVHKDLWANNILFKYNDDVPSNAVFVDFQATRFGPPAFDVMVFLYYTTSRSFRQHHEKKLLSHYYSSFLQTVDEPTKERLNKIGYSLNNFLEWCEKARLFGMIIGLTVYPFILMDATTAQRTYDDPDTFYTYMMEDRSEPTLAYARENSMFRDRLLEISEEFVERYISC